MQAKPTRLGLQALPESRENGHTSHPCPAPFITIPLSFHPTPSPSCLPLTFLLPPAPCRPRPGFREPLARNTELVSCGCGISTTLRYIRLEVSTSLCIFNFQKGDIYDLLLLGKSCTSFGKHLKAEAQQASWAVTCTGEFHFEVSEKSIKWHRKVAA